MVEAVRPSSKVEWRFVKNGKTVFTSTEFLDCVKKKNDNNGGRIVSTGAKESTKD